MKDYKSLIADIRTEACELADKIKRLEVFMMSEDFCKISPEQKGLLETQYDLMAKYKVTLVKRAHRINFEHANRTTKERLKELLEEREESEKRPPALTFDTNPEICEKCIHHTKSWSTCQACVDGSNCSLKEKEPELPRCPYLDDEELLKCARERFDNFMPSDGCPWIEGNRCSATNTDCYRFAVKPVSKEQD